MHHLDFGGVRHVDGIGGASSVHGGPNMGIVSPYDTLHSVASGSATEMVVDFHHHYVPSEYWNVTPYKNGSTPMKEMEGESIGTFTMITVSSFEERRTLT